jgi:hypothetical protein
MVGNSQTKNPNFSVILEGLGTENFGTGTLWPFGIFIVTF